MKHNKRITRGGNLTLALLLVLFDLICIQSEKQAFRIFESKGFADRDDGKVEQRVNIKIL